MIHTTLLMILFLLGYNSISLAASDNVESARQSWQAEHFKAEGAPIPDGGITIVPVTQLSHYHLIKEKRIKQQQDIALYGYVKQYNPEAKRLLDFKIIAEHQYQKHKDNLNPTDTHLRRTIQELQMAYTFIGAPESKIIQTIGVAPYLTYLKGQGWIGAIQFFEHTGIGVCAYSENNIKLSHASVIIAQEDVRNDINHKTTTIEISGTEDSGLLYDIEWYDLTFFRQLQCAHPTYSPKVIHDVIELANQIDSQ